MTVKNNAILQGEKVQLPTKYGYFELIPFQEKLSGLEHIVLIKGSITSKKAMLTRVHSACATGDLFGSLKCDCGEQLIKAMDLIENNKSGIIVYLQQEGRGIGLMNKMKAYKLQEQGLNTIEANVHLGFAPDEREYQICAEILNTIGVTKVKLLTNNPDKVIKLEQSGIQVVKRIPLIIPSNPYNITYLNTKENKMGHQLNEGNSENKYYDN